MFVILCILLWNYGVGVCLSESFLHNGYLIPFSHLLHFRRHVFPLIRDSCDYVCPYTKPCDGYNFLDFIEKTLSIRTKCCSREKMLFSRFLYLRLSFLKEMKFMEWKRFAVESFVFCCREWNCSFLLLSSLLFFVAILAIRWILIDGFCFWKAIFV